MGYWGDLKDEDEGMAPATVAAPGRVVRSNDYGDRIPNRSAECEHGTSLGVYCRQCAASWGSIKHALQPFRKRWRFVAEVTGPCTVYKWTARSPSVFVHETHDVEQWPELVLQPGRVEFELNGPDDLQLVALVRLKLETSSPMYSMLGFVREPLDAAGG